MSAEYSVARIRKAAKETFTIEQERMLTAYAERIDADEGAVPVAHIARFIDGNGMDASTIGMDRAAYELPYGDYALFTHPPAQAAQVDRARETPRRQQAVEMLLELGWTYNSERGWEEPATTAPPASPAGVPDPTVLYTVEEVAEAQETLRKHNRTLMGEVIDQMIDVLLAAAPSATPEGGDHA